MRHMANARIRAKNILRALPLSRKQRDLYERGVEGMDEGMLEGITSKLESSLSRAPKTLLAAQKLLAQPEARSRKRAVIWIEDKEFRHDLTGLLSRTMEIETPHAPEEAIQAIGRDRPEVVILDFKMPAMSGLEVLRQMRRVVSFQNCTIIVLTYNAEEDGQVAAAGAMGYRASNTVTDLSRVVTSAVESRV
jgi:CheY-like chemotaxis protein